jgi:predicted GNAT family acetyltransferase
MDFDITHNPAASRFEAQFDAGLAVAVYRLVGHEMQMTHTEVPPSLEGRGIAAKLVAAALDHARDQGWTVRPLCSYVRSYMQRNPDTQDLMAR